MLGGLRRSFVVALTVAAVFAVDGVAPHPPAAAAPTADSATAPSAFSPVRPCRLRDTRVDGDTRVRARGVVDIDVTGHCGVPDDAVVAAVTITAVEPAGEGFLTAFATGQPMPDTSAVNYRRGDVIANQQFVRVGARGRISVFSLASSDVVVDVSGYFTPAPRARARAGRFVAVSQRRLLDTRDSGRPRARTAVRVDPALRAAASAVVVNITTTATSGPGFFTAYPAGSRRPGTSTLNADRVDQTRAATAVVALGPGGFDVFTSRGDHVIVDLVGYFTGPEASRSDSGLFVGSEPVRLVDTRRPPGPGGGPRLWDRGTREFSVRDVTGEQASAVATNLTVTATEDAGFAVAFPAGGSLPGTSTVNYDRPQHTIANGAIVRLTERGLAVLAIEAAHVTVDVTGWFTGSPTAATRPVAPNHPPPDRVVTIISDSAMAGLRWNRALGGLQGFHAIPKLESCRRLVAYSCRGREGYAPRSVVSEIHHLPYAGPEEILVVATGYNDWHGRFADDFDTVVETARDRGFHHIAWVDYRSDVGYKLPGTGGVRSNYGEMNRILGEKLATGDYPDVRRWRLDDYTAGSVGWFYADGVHERRLGSWAVADWLSRHVRAFDERPCVREWAPGGAVEQPCPNPDDARARRGLPDIATLYAAAIGG